MISSVQKRHFTGRSLSGIRGAALVVALLLLVAVSAAVMALLTVVRWDQQSSSLVAASTRADILARSMGIVILGDLLTEIANGSENLGTAERPSFLPRESSAALPQRVLARSEMAAEAKFGRLIKQSVPGPFHQQFGSGPAGPARASAVNTSEAARNGRLLSVSRWNFPVLVEDSGFQSNAELPNWIYVTDASSRDPAGLNPTSWDASFADADSDQKVIGRVAYNLYEIGGLLDVNVAGRIPGSAKSTMLGSLATAELGRLPGMEDPTRLIAWRNSATGTDVETFQQYAQRDGLRAGFLERPDGDRRFLSRQDLLAYVRNNPEAGLSEDTLPYLTHFTRSIDRPSVSASQVGTDLLAGYPARPAAINPAPLTVRRTIAATLPDGTTLRVGDPVAARRFPLRRLDLLSDDAMASESDADPIYRYFGLHRSSPDEPWIYNHGEPNRILTLAEVAGLAREPDFFEMLQAAISSGSLGGSAGQDGIEHMSSMPRANLDKNIYRHVLQIGANLIDQYDSNDVPTEIVLDDASGNAMSVFGVENLPYISEIPIFIYRSVADPNRVRVGGWLQFEIWNPHQNADDVAPHRMRIAATRGRARLRLNNPGSGWQVGTDYPPGFTAATDQRTGPGIDFSASPSFLEFTNGPELREPRILGPAEFGSHPVRADGTTTSGLIVEESTPVTPMDPVPRNIKFAGILVDEVDAPDDRVDGVPDQMAYGENAPGVYGGFTFVFPSPLFLEVQLETPAGWRTVQRFENINSTQANKRTWGTSGVTLRNDPNPQLWSGWNRIGELPDPRTSRFSFLFSDSADPARSMRNSIPQWGMPGGANSFRGPGWTFASQRRPLAFLASNIADNPYFTATGTIFYADPDGTVRRGDGEERPTVAEANRVFPLVEGRSQDRPIVLNRPFESVGEMGYAFRDGPWKTLDFWTPESGDAALLDYFAIEETALSESNLPLRAGTVNLNTAPPAVLAAVLEGAAINEIQGSALSGVQADQLAEGLRDALGDAPIASVADLPKLVENAASGPSAMLGHWRKTEKEALVRALAPVANPNTWNVLLDIIAQEGIFPPNADGLADFVVRAEARYWVFAAIDRTSGRIIEVQYEPVNE